MLVHKIKIETYDDFIKYVKHIPSPVIQDVDKRISDWLASGGTTEDAYIKQQYRYVENVVNHYLNKGGK